MTARAAFAVLLVAASGGCGPRGEVGILPFYPGAAIVGEGEYQGRAFGFGPAAWRRTDLTVSAPYERVRDFYARIRPSGWTSTFAHETIKDAGRRYDRYLTDARRREFYAIQVQEELGGLVHQPGLGTPAAAHTGALSCGEPGPPQTELRR